MEGRPHSASIPLCHCILTGQSTWRMYLTMPEWEVGTSDRPGSSLTRISSAVTPQIGSFRPPVASLPARHRLVAGTDTCICI